MLATPSSDRFNLVDRSSNLLTALRTSSPWRFGRMNIRVCNGAVALTGSVPTFYAKALAFQNAKSVLGDSPIIDALEVSDRRSYSFLPADG